MRNILKGVALALCFALAVGAFGACKKEKTDGLVNVYDGGDVFEFGKWQGDEIVYKISETDGGTSVNYAKLSSDTKAYPLFAEVQCGRSFRFVNFEVSGTENKEVSVKLGNDTVSAAFIGEQRFFLTEKKTIYTYKLKNRVALPALEDIYLNADPSSFGLNAQGKIDIHRAWFSDEVPDGAVYEDAASLKNYQFVSGASWSRCNGWFVDTSWTNIRLLPAPNKGVKISTTDNDAAASFASVIFPIEPAADAQKFTLTFENIGNSVTDVAVLLRGGQRSWNESGGYWDYYEAQTEFWTNPAPTSTDTGTVTIEYDLAKGMTTIGDNVDGDGLMIVVFFETHGNHPDQNLRDGKFELNIASANCK